MIKPDKKEFFDFLAPDWPEKELTGRERALFAGAGRNGKGCVIDLGGGNGRLARFLARRRRGRVIVVDFSLEMLKAAGEGAGKIIRVQADAHRLPFADSAAALVVCYSAFPHFDRQEGVLRECRRVLRDGGELIVAHSRSRREINRFHARQCRAVSGDFLPPPVRFRAWAADLGWKILRLEDGEESFIVHYRR